MKEVESEISIKKKNDHKITYYRPSEVERYCLSSKFEARFEEIRDSFITKGFCATISAFMKWRTKYENKGIPDDLNEL
jgi:hypothetical protein